MGGEAELGAGDIGRTSNGSFGIVEGITMWVALGLLVFIVLYAVVAYLLPNYLTKD